jgi:hypothetical protein
MAVAGTLFLDWMVFPEPVQLEVAARWLSCRHTRFRAGGHVRVAWAEISLEDAEITAPLIVSGHPPASGLATRVGWLADPDDGDPERSFPPAMPSLVNVRRADVAGLVVADIDLGDCRFAGAHHLDQLQIATADAFRRAPACLGRGRQVLAEEAAWRAARGGRRARRWQQLAGETFRSPLLSLPPLSSGSELLGVAQVGGQEGRAALRARQPGPGELAGIYRRLRKGREEAKNEPGAASFYYGECEMRRHAPTTPPVERWILAGYWATSGYALRAWRALAALVVVIGLVGVGFSRVGFHHPHPSLTVSWLYALQATVSLEGKARQLSGQLTLPGELLRVGLRLTGPVLLGLALLSVRNRVKR